MNYFFKSMFRLFITKVTFLTIVIIFQACTKTNEVNPDTSKLQALEKFKKEILLAQKKYQQSITKASSSRMSDIQSISDQAAEQYMNSVTNSGISLLTYGYGFSSSEIYNLYNDSFDPRIGILSLAIQEYESENGAPEITLEFQRILGSVAYANKLHPCILQAAGVDVFMDAVSKGLTKQVIGKAAAKIAKRAIPYAGWGLMAYSFGVCMEWF